MVYWHLFRKSFACNMQYRLSHLINNAASAIFGFVYIAIWTGVLTGKEQKSPYSILDMTYYMGASQCILWMTVFLTAGLGIQLGVRNGAISIELARPVSYYFYVVSQEAGRIAYNALFRSLPIGLIFSLTVGFYVPSHWTTLGYSLLSLLLAIGISLNIFYLIGISSCWTTEISWAHFIILTLMFSLGGQMVPLTFLPEFLSQLAKWLPFAGVVYYPVLIFLEKADHSVLLLQAGWLLVLFFANHWITAAARQKVEIQGE
ncbi:ABC-2 family transporter protein [Fictibacillus enclensis]|uniref:ABC transporter permease n=1 Tax=Fictibacillus enclensis TaxID=1017270 RepID=UPI0025A2AE0D|nr:ABC-2 family transporter protein [Fictibacillus enclensis]MDM5337693.1 ABC-2 family transporter protein [Fictibacillus enclensis]